MARKLGQIIAVREGVWMVRIPLGRTRETQTRNYYNRTIYGSLRKAQKYLSKKMGEIGANHQGSPGKIRLSTYLDRWLKAMKARVTDKTYQTYGWLLNRHIRPVLGDKLLVAIEPLDIQTAYEKMTESSLAAGPYSTFTGFSTPPSGRRCSGRFSSKLPAVTSNSPASAGGKCRC